MSRIALKFNCREDGCAYSSKREYSIDIDGYGGEEQDDGEG